MKKVSGSTTTLYIYSGSKVIAEYDNGAAVGSPSREYIYSGGALVAKIDSSGTEYYHQDHLSNRLVTDSSGSTLAQMGHFSFGESWYNATNDKLLFTTYERDSESGNDYAKARYSMSRLGRFSSPDLVAGSPSDPQSLNRFAYAQNDPINFTDPSGTFIAPLLRNLFNNFSGLSTGGFGSGWNEFDLLNSSTVLEGFWINWHVRINPESLGEAWTVIDSIEPVYGGLLTDPGDPGGGQAPLNERNQKRFDKARQKALVGLDNPDCQKFLRDHGIDPAWVRDAINSQVPWDASKSTITLYDANAYAPYTTPPAFYHTMSMARYFRVNTNTMGMAEALGTSAYYRPGGILGSGGIKPGNIFHEAIHNAIGLSDDDLAEKLGVHGGGSKDINPALAAHHCI